MDALPSDHENSISDASSSIEDDSDVEGTDVRIGLGSSDNTAGADAPRQKHGGRDVVAQRSRSWDVSVEEGMARIDADAAAEDVSGIKR